MVHLFHHGSLQFGPVAKLNRYFFNRYHAKDIDERTMQLASRILVRYLDICFKQDQRNDEMNKAIELLKLLPNKVEFGGV